MSLFDEVMDVIESGPQEEFEAVISSEVLFALSKMLTPVQFQDIIIAKNIRIYGEVNAYIASFVQQTVAGLMTMAEGPAKEATKKGQTAFIEKLLAREDISEESRRLLESARLDLSTSAAAAAGGKRRRLRRRQTIKKALHRSGKTIKKKYPSK
jgi:hypothetical protein